MKYSPSFHPSKLSKDPDDPLPGQRIPPLQPVIVKDDEKWELDNILELRRHRGRI